MLRFLRIVHPRNVKLSLPRVRFTSRVFAGCSVNPSRFITSPIRRSPSLAADSVRHMATKSSAYRTRLPSWLHLAAQVRLITIHRIANSKIAEDWVLVESLGLFQQLGVLPDTAELIRNFGSH